MNAEARRSLRIQELTRYFLQRYHASKNPELAYRDTLIRAKKYASPQTAKEYLDEILRRVGK